MGAQNRLRQKKHQEKAASGGSVTAGVAEQLQYKLQQHKQLHSLQLLMLLLPDPNYNILKVCSLFPLYQKMMLFVCTPQDMSIEQSYQKTFFLEMRLDMQSGEWTTLSEAVFNLPWIILRMLSTWKRCNFFFNSIGWFYHVNELSSEHIWNRIWKDLLLFLHKVAENSERNKMNALNLGTLFAAHLMCPRKMSSEELQVARQLPLHQRRCTATANHLDQAFLNSGPAGPPKKN